MGKFKHIAPMPQTMEEALARILELEQDAKDRRASKTESMRKWRARKQSPQAYENE